MDFKAIQFKMIKANMNKYGVFLICNIFSIAILQSFLSIVLNDQFMNPSIVDSMISSNIYAPTFLLLIFNIIFIPYTQSIFIKARQKDYGILLTLGMSDREMRNNIFRENFYLIMSALIIGLLLGTLLSLFFMWFISNVIGINNINFSISLKSYEITAVCVFAIFIVSLLINLYSVIKTSIYEKIKSSESSESRKYYNIKFIYLGILINIISFGLMIIYYSKNSNVWLISILVCMVGSILIFFNGESLIDYFKNHHYNKYLKNIFLFSDIKYYYGKNKRIFFATTWIFFIMSFFIMFSLVTYPNFKNNSLAYHPFHMVYAEMKNQFNPISDKEIQSIAENNGNKVILNEKIKFLRDNEFTIFSVEDINRILKRDYKVKDGSYIYIYPYYMKDGYEHDINSARKNIDINFGKSSKKFTIDSIAIDPLVGQVNCISNYILIVNEDDFNMIKKSEGENYFKGMLHLYNFDSWQHSDGIINTVWNKLIKQNIKKDDLDFYKISSRIDSYNTALKSSRLLVFSMIYVGLLLYFSAIIMIYFKLIMEYEDEKKKYYSLYRIGIKDLEIRKIIFQKISAVYYIPLIYATIINVMYSYCTNNSYGYGFVGIGYGGITSSIFLLVHILVCKLYSNGYYKKVLLEVK